MTVLHEAITGISGGMIMSDKGERSFEDIEGISGGMQPPKIASYADSMLYYCIM